MGIRKLMALACLFAAPAHAVPVTLYSEWEGYSFGYGYMLMTYEDSVPDSNPDPLKGLYTSSVLALDFVFPNITFSITPNTTADITITAQQQSAGNIGFNVSLTDSNNVTYGTMAALEIYDMWTGGTDSLDTIDGRIANEGGFILKMTPTRWFFFNQRTAFVSQAPEPSVFTLLSIGLGMLAWKSRKRVAQSA